jgi:hypothetical protein
MKVLFVCILKQTRKKKKFPSTPFEPTQNILEDKRKATAENVLITTNRKLRQKQWDHKFLHISLNIVTNVKTNILSILCSNLGLLMDSRRFCKGSCNIYNFKCTILQLQNSSYYRIKFISRTNKS